MAVKMFFDNFEEMDKLCTEWRERLGLNDWTISLRFAYPHELSSVDFAGESNVQWITKCALISIRKPECIPNSDGEQPQPQELVLIHELLHCKFFGVEQAHPTIEGLFWDTMQHALLEDMAKALYCAKYNLPRSFFTAPPNTEVS